MIEPNKIASKQLALLVKEAVQHQFNKNYVLSSLLLSVPTKDCPEGQAIRWYVIGAPEAYPLFSIQNAEGIFCRKLENLVTFDSTVKDEILAYDLETDSVRMIEERSYELGKLSAPTVVRVPDPATSVPYVLPHRVLSFSEGA